MLSGQTNSSQTLPKLPPSQAGRYHVVATNPAGSVSNRVVWVTFTDANTLERAVHPSLRIFGTFDRMVMSAVESATDPPA